MRKTIVVIGWILCASTAHAQALDVSGVELRIGDDATAAMTRLAQALPSGLHVGRVHVSRGSEPVDTTSQWIVTKDEKRGPYSSINVASVGVKDGLISMIAKYYDLGDGADIATVYTAAMRDARREAFEPCTTAPVRLGGELIRSIKTVCGRYELNFVMSWQSKDGPGHTETSISVIVGSVAVKMK